MQLGLGLEGDACAVSVSERSGRHAMRSLMLISQRLSASRCRSRGRGLSRMSKPAAAMFVTVSRSIFPPPFRLTGVWARPVSAS